MLAENANVKIDDARIVHRTRGRFAFVLSADNLFYVFLRDPMGRYGWTYGYKSKTTAIRRARDADRYLVNAERERLALLKTELPEHWKGIFQR
jgi:hypothetical protein